MSILGARRSVMMLYADPQDPFGHGVRIVLAEKDVNVEVHFVDSDHRPEDLADLNPYNQVLTLIDRDLVLYDVAVMMEYLDERFPHPPLMPVDPVARATNRQIRARVVTDLYDSVSDIEHGDSRAANSARKILRDNITAIAPVFAQHTYFMSADYSLIDCCVAPVLWRLDKYGIRLPAQAKPVLKYADRLFGREAFRASLSAVEREMTSVDQFD